MKKVLLIAIITGLFQMLNAQAPNWLWGEAETTGSCWMNGTGVWVGASDSIYINGRFNGTMTLGGVAVTATSGGSEVFSGKMGSNGNFKWISEHQYSNGTDYCYGMGGDQQENTYSTGLTQGSNGFFIDKYDKHGNMIWNVAFGAGIGGYGNVVTDNSSNVYVTGGFNGTQNFGPNTLNAIGSNDLFLAKYNSASACQWALHVGGAGQDVGGRGVAIDPAGNIYVIGCYSGTTSFYNTSNVSVRTLANTGTTDVFIAKYNSSGTLVWVATGTNGGFAAPPPSYWSFNSITVDSCSNVYITGHYTGTAKFGSLPGITSAGSADIYVAKCHYDGNWEWVQTAGGSSDDEGEGIALDKYNDVYVTGYFEGTANFGSQSVNTSGGSAIFVAKYANSTGALQWVQAPGGNGSTGGSGIAIDSKGFVYLTGSISTVGSATFGPNTFSGVTSCGQNVLIAKLDTLPRKAIIPQPQLAYCAGQCYTLPITVIGTFNAGNVFTAQLSDATGNFANGGINLGTLAATASGTINICFPANLAAGTNYVLRVTSSNPNYCSEEHCNTITIHPEPSVTLSAPPTVCSGSSTTLTVSGGVSYTWNTGATTSSISVSPTSNTTYSVSVSNGSCSKDTSINVKVNPLPVVNVTAPSVCSGSSATITTNVNGGSSPYSYAWSSGLTSTTSTATVTVTSSQTYTVDVTDANGCSSSGQGTVNVYSNPVASFLVSPTNTSILSPTIHFTNTSTGQYPVNSYYWTFGDALDSAATSANTVHTYQDTGYFCAKLVIKDIHGCVDSATNCLTITPQFTFYIPTAFTPNGNGLNDVFIPKGNDIKAFSMSIFDRWGMQIYHTTDMNKGWNGAVNGSGRAQEDTYVYVINVTDAQNIVHDFTGRLTLLR